ncbi:toll-like receptor 4 [Ruditapes philippinarum]|uniref:toll-like receptor 4 n=1 Tax=Ruditapes philippinarum TaxID=129788 RepID=UPI00295B0949|nr:toll-like receptor 4 [Ruditapes philippinarum]
MKFVLLFASIICIVDSSSLSCGPDGLCQCEHIDVMDCSENKQLPLRNVCDYMDDSKDVNITILHLEQNGYKYIRTEDIKGCKSLKTLFLKLNEISYIEDVSLTKFDNLKTLDMSFNQLDIYNKRGTLAFKLPLSLKKLVLNGNLNVTDYGGAMYPDLSNLFNVEQLIFDGLKDTNFPESYSEIQSLRSVSLSGLDGNCSIPYVSNDTFQHLTHVRTLNLSFCNIQNVTAGAFEKLKNLEVLDLSQNMNIGFRKAMNVTYSLQFTKIKSLNISKLYPTFGLGTQIKLQDLCYLWNTNLTELVLNDNRIELIDRNVLILTPNTLKIIRAEGNTFTFGPYLYQLGCMSHLEEFYGNFQSIVRDPHLYMKEPNTDESELITINLNCPYTAPEVLKNISKMKRGLCPYLKDNKININKTFPTFPTKMKRLEFSNCGMQYNATDILVKPVPYKMEYIDASDNILYSWIGPCGPFPNVKYLNLSRNYCSHIGLNFFDSFKNLENLQIQENFLGLVLSNEYYGPGIFEKLSKVKVMNLSSNIISYLHPTVFSNMVHLTKLDLSVNNIESLDIDVGSLNNLMHLNLKFNFIHSVPSHLREKLELNSKRLNKNFTIDLSNNTLSVSCDEKDFLEWMVKHRMNMLNFDHYKFHNMSGQRVNAERFVSDVMKLDMDCGSYSLPIVACSIGISVYLSVVIGGAIYKNRWNLRYLMRMNKIKHFGYIRLHQYFNEPERFMYDAFISYANEDLRFILDVMMPKLEGHGLKLCLHDKDFLPGNNIADNILQAIGDSRKTVAVISEQFLKSEWCLFEFNMARMESIYSRGGNSCLIIVILEDVPTRNMSNEMLDWMRTNTYIEYTQEENGELLFWDNFLRVLNA